MSQQLPDTALAVSHHVTEHPQLMEISGRPRTEDVHSMDSVRTLSEMGFGRF